VQPVQTASVEVEGEPAIVGNPSATAAITVGIEDVVPTTLVGTYPVIVIPPECAPSGSWIGFDPTSTFPTIPTSCFETTLPPTLPVPSTTTLPTATTLLGPTTTTTLLIGPPEPTADNVEGIPLRLTLTSQQAFDSNGSNTHDFTVARGAIIEVVLDNADLKPEVSGDNPFDPPGSQDPTIIEPIQPRHPCPPGSVCGTFAAVAAGSTFLGASVPGGEGMCLCFSITVVDPTGSPASATTTTDVVAPTLRRFVS
jgi:hypothetical protein